MFDFWFEIALAICKADFLSSWQEEMLVREVIYFGEMLCFALKSDFFQGSVWGTRSVSGDSRFAVLLNVLYGLGDMSAFYQRCHFCKQVYCTASIRRSFTA